MIEVVGVQASGVRSLPEDLRALVRGAAVVVGPPRLLESLPDQPEQQRIAWPRPMLAGLDGLLERLAEGPHPVVVLASGDPLDSGIGTTLINRIGLASVRIHPAVGSIALARARLGWSRAETDVLSLVSTSAYAVRALLTPGRKILLLSADEETPGKVLVELDDAGWPEAEVTVLGNLGTEDETRLELSVVDYADPSEIPRLNIVAVQLPWHAETVGTSPGRPDEDFAHDGQLTKREVRASALAALRPAPGQVLWDIGAGAGSVAIEWALHDPRCIAVAIERDPLRSKRIESNADGLGVPGLHVINGNSADEYDGLPPPDAVFFGGGITEEAIDMAWQMMNPGGRMVAHAVTIETERLLFDAMQRYGGSMRRITIERVEPLGSFLSWKPARSVVEWAAAKPAEPSHRRRVDL